MSSRKLDLPLRQGKPRKRGMTILIDNGVPLGFFKDVITSSPDLVDFVKFGWGTSIVTEKLREKIQCLQEENIDFFFGGTLFEKFLNQGKVDEYYRYCKEYGCKFVEISNGTLPITNREKAKFIFEFSKEFVVFSEVGSKDLEKSDIKDSSEWIYCINEDLEAGAYKVITEARESGTSGLCNGNGEVRLQIVEDIISSGINMNNIIFEAPTKSHQTLFIKMIGANVNLANIPFTNAIPLETLRLGLRSDTFYLVQYDFEWRHVHEGQK